MLRAQVSATPYYTRGSNQDWKNLVILCSILDELLRSYLEELRKLGGAMDAGIGIADLVGNYSQLRQNGLKGIELTHVQQKAYETLENMLAGVAILVDPILLLYTLDSQGQETLEANAVAHPSLTTIRKYLEAERAQPQVPGEARSILNILVSAQSGTEILLDLPDMIGGFIKNLTLQAMSH